MKGFRMQMTLRWMMIAVAVISSLLFLLSKTVPRTPILRSTSYDADIGMTFRHSRYGPAPPPGGPFGTFGAGVGKTSRGATIHWVAYTDGLGGGELVEFEEGSMRLRVGDLDYGPIVRGDLVDFGLGEIRINGNLRTPLAARTGHKPPRWVGRGLFPGDLVFPD